MDDLRARVIGSPEISADGFPAYPWAVSLAFGEQCKFGVIEKHYAVNGSPEAARRYSPGQVVSVSKNAVFGRPAHISTSYVERQNLTLRMTQRRFTRLTNGFSKTYLNHCAAVALYVAHYNLCRVHEALRVTPAMQLGVSDHVWTIGELVQTALNGVTQEPQGRKVGRLWCNRRGPAMTGGVSTKQSRWGQPMQYGLTELEAYDAMLKFLTAYWERGAKGPRDIAVLLGDINRNTFMDLQPGDPAQWNDWLDAVAKVKGERSGLV